MNNAQPEPLNALAYQIKLAIVEANIILAESKDSTAKITAAETLADLQRALAILEAKIRSRQNSL